MARALLLFERQADASWLPTTVILATPKRLQGKSFPGDANRDARLASILTNALPPRISDLTEERGTFLDWVDWALDAFGNGHTSWATEVVPTATVEALSARSCRCGGTGMDRGPGSRGPARPPAAVIFRRVPATD
jgi:hypothetical protein